MAPSMSPTLQTSEFVNQLLASKEFFERSSRVLEEADSQFRPEEGMMTAAQQFAHAAQTLDWFVEGVTRPEGFDLDFEKHATELMAVTIDNMRSNGGSRQVEKARREPNALVSE